MRPTRLAIAVLVVIGISVGLLPRVTSARKAEAGVGYYNPDWSPDGSSLAFESSRDGKEAVYTIRVDGSEIGRAHV